MPLSIHKQFSYLLVNFVRERIGRLSRNDVLLDKRRFCSAIPGTTPESPFCSRDENDTVEFDHIGRIVSRARSRNDGFLDKL